MKIVLLIATALLLATNALGVIDTGENSVGVYFDEGADVYCLDGVVANDHVAMYFILVNPSFDSLYGWEGGIDIVGNALVISRNFYVNVGFQGPLNNMIIGYAAPYPTSIATPLVALEVLYLDAALEAVAFYVHGTTPSSIDPDYPTLLTNNGELIMAGISVVGGPSAQINGDCLVVSTENIRFDSIKSLYRN